MSIRINYYSDAVLKIIDKWSRCITPEVDHMRSTGMRLWFLIVLLSAPFGSAHAATLDCEGGIISAGDSRMDLLMKCGEPDGKESHDEELVDRPDLGTRRKLFIAVEEWTYNFGPAKFMRIVTLKNGTVSNIHSGKYGYSKDTKPEQRECGEQIVTIGDSKSEVIAKCGEPAGKDFQQEELKKKLDSGQERSVFVTIEEWTYNLGPNRFVRILIFRNGKLTEIKTGGYGYEMKQEEIRK
jgi:hypothetical protein